MTYVDRVVKALDAKIPGNPPALLRHYAVLVLVRGAATTGRDVHDAWAAWRLETQPDHRCLVPYGQLPAVVQELDEPYAAAIREVAMTDWGVSRD